MVNNIKVLLCEDELNLANLLVEILQNNGYDITWCENGAKGWEAFRHGSFDIVLLDVMMPEMDGIEATKEILSKWKEAKIIIVTSFIDDEKVYPAISAGAKSYLLKTSSASEIAQAIRDTYRGEGVFEKEVSEKLEHRHEVAEEFRLFEELTSREKEVLLLIAQGKSNQEIADECFITLKTVKTHVSNILSKLQVEDRTQATIYAFKHHLVQP